MKIVETGFKGLPSGQRIDDASYIPIGYFGFWWSSSEDSTANVYGRCLNYASTYIYGRGSMVGIQKQCGLSVRCLKDN